MSASTPAGPRSEGHVLQPPAFGRPSPARIASADHGYARFLTAQAAHADTGDHGQDDNAPGPR